MTAYGYRNKFWNLSKWINLLCSTGCLQRSVLATLRELALAHFTGHLCVCVCVCDLGTSTNLHAKHSWTAVHVIPGDLFMLHRCPRLSPILLWKYNTFWHLPLQFCSLFSVISIQAKKVKFPLDNDTFNNFKCLNMLHKSTNQMYAEDH